MELGKTFFRSKFFDILSGKIKLVPLSVIKGKVPFSSCIQKSLYPFHALRTIIQDIKH